MFSKQDTTILKLLVSFLSVINYIQNVETVNRMSNLTQINRDLTLRTGGRYHLPLPTGPYPNIGYIDIMTGTNRNDGVLVRVLYPDANQSVDPKVNYLKWPNWYPSDEYKRGYFSSTMVFKLLDYLSSDVFIPSVQNVEPLRLNDQTFPVIIFSHGLSGFRTTYSSVCNELVSYGFIVFVVEHRDGSASTTFYPNNDGPEPFKWIPYKNWGDFNNQFGGRSEQLDIRVTDIQKTIGLINDLQNEKVVKNILNPYINRKKFAEIFDLNKIIVMGHSFGGPTAIRAIKSIKAVKLAVCLDAWMYGLNGNDANRISKPILFVNNERFQWRANLRAMKKYIGNNGKNTNQRKVFTLKGSRHTDQSDSPFISRNFISRISRISSRIDPFIVHDLTTALSLQFIEDVLQIKLKKYKNNFIDKYRNYLEEGI